jgi:hypothetical protein
MRQKEDHGRQASVVVKNVQDQVLSACHVLWVVAISVVSMTVAFQGHTKFS